MKKRVLITGTSGMLGSVLAKDWSNEYQLTTVYDRRQFNFAQGNYAKLFKRTKPEIIVHCAALTNLEYCENNPEEALSVNGESVGKLVNVMPQAKMIFISSETVFPPNTKNAKEDTPINPKTIYGESKKLGEELLLQADGGTVIRTTIVGRNINKPGNSLTEWIVNSLKHKSPITLFDDVWFTPISIWHLSEALTWVIENQTPRVLHIAGGERVTKYQFGYELAKFLGLPTNLINCLEKSCQN